MSEAYCVKCKKKQEMKDEKIVEMKNSKRPGIKRSAGICPVCGTKMSRILPKEKKE